MAEALEQEAEEIDADTPGPDERPKLHALQSVRMAGEPEDESVHFYVCKACGQAVDKRNLGDVFHHEEKGHAPLPTAS